jgi:hypothetical protein
VLKTLGTALLLAAGLAITSDRAFAIQTIVTQVDKNADGSMTYHFAVKLDQGETHFYGMVDGSVKSPPGWEFSSEEFGRTPTSNGYPVVLPLDVPNTPNLTWTATKPVPAGAQIDGFVATTRVGAIVQGQYSAQVTRELPAIQGAGGGTPSAAAKTAKQAVIGALQTPSFLATVK